MIYLSKVCRVATFSSLLVGALSFAFAREHSKETDYAEKEGPYQIQQPLEKHSKKVGNLQQERAQYLALEKKADAEFQSTFDLDWKEANSYFRREQFYQKIMKKYQNAFAKALAVGNIADASRIRIKEAEVLVKSDILNEELRDRKRAVDLLLEAWDLGKQIGQREELWGVEGTFKWLVQQELAFKDIEKMSKERYENFRRQSDLELASAYLLEIKVASKLYPERVEELKEKFDGYCLEKKLSEKDLYPNYPPMEDDEDGSDFNRWIDLLESAEGLEALGLTDDAARVYEEAANECMAMFDEDCAAGRTHPCIFAGLCYEKIPSMKSRAKEVFTLAANSYQDLNCPEYEQMPIVFQWIYKAPRQREMALVALLLEDWEMFAGAMLQALREAVKSRDWMMEEGSDMREARQLQSYVGALISVSEVFLGADDQSVLKMKELAQTTQIADERVQKTCEVALLDIFADPKGTAILELWRRIENEELPQP